MASVAARASRQPPTLLDVWRRFERLPAGRALFTWMVCRKAPYFASIQPRFEELRSGFARVSMRKRRAVTNHIGTVHAIAMCNLAELAAGTMTEASIPRTMRWLPKGMQVEYLKKAETDMEATATLGPVEEGAARDVPVLVEVRDRSGAVACRATITMWVSPRK